jgi:uncharacterized membrane protein
LLPRASVSRHVPLIAVALTVLLWVTAVLAAPAAASSGGVIGLTAAAVTYSAGAIVCHQRPERSFHYGTAQLPVCARCLGLYLGGFGGALFWLVLSGIGRRRAEHVLRLTATPTVRAVLLIAAIPTVASVASGWIGWWDAGNVVRAVFAVPLGVAVGATVSAVAARDLR